LRTHDSTAGDGAFRLRIVWPDDYSSVGWQRLSLH
jgi:hypothetical protein